MTGVISQGIECPIIREGDNIVDIVVDSVLNSIDKHYYSDIHGSRPCLGSWEPNINDKDIIGITESVVARTAGQYITVDDIAADIEKKFGKDATICLIEPIYSRNRFSMILKGIARAAHKVYIAMPAYDIVGNPRGVNPFTGVNIEEYYKELCESENCECEIVNDFGDIEWKYRHGNCIDCRVHNYLNSDKVGKEWYSLEEICSDKSPDWGVLGTNKATEERLKLFPSKAECQRVCEAVKTKIKEKTNRDVIVCIYGDGCFKDPIGEIWEFADPCSMPGYTDKELIESTPVEVKLKYAIDAQSTGNNRYHDDTALKQNIDILKSESMSTYMKSGSMGTTPRVYRDLLASLMDLTSGSGDRVTPVVLIQNYFR